MDSAKVEAWVRFPARALKQLTLEPDGAATGRKQLWRVQLPGVSFKSGALIPAIMLNRLSIIQHDWA